MRIQIEEEGVPVYEDKKEKREVRLYYGKDGNMRIRKKRERLGYYGKDRKGKNERIILPR